VFCLFKYISGIIDGDYTYLPVDGAEDQVFQVANMTTPELMELMNMYNRSCSHISFDQLPGPLSMCPLPSIDSLFLISFHSFISHKNLEDQQRELTMNHLTSATNKAVMRLYINYCPQ